MGLDEAVYRDVLRAFGSAQCSAFGSAFGSAQCSAFGRAQCSAFGSAYCSSERSAYCSANGSSERSAYCSAECSANGSSERSAYCSAECSPKCSAECSLLLGPRAAAAPAAGTRPFTGGGQERASHVVDICHAALGLGERAASARRHAVRRPSEVKSERATSGHS